MRKLINAIAMIVIGILAVLGIWAVSPLGTIWTLVVSVVAIVLIQIWNIIEERYTERLRAEYEQACIERKAIGVMNRTEHEKEIAEWQRLYKDLREQNAALKYDFASQVQATEQAEARYEILADKWRDINSKYTHLLSRQENGVVITDTSNGEHTISGIKEIKVNVKPTTTETIPFVEEIKQCECGSDMNKRKVYWVCPNCGKRVKR